MTPNQVKEILGEIYQCEIKAYRAGRLAMFSPVDSFSLPLMYQDGFFQMHRNVQTRKESSDILEIINDYKKLKDRIELVDRTFQYELETQDFGGDNISFVLETVLEKSVQVDIDHFHFSEEIDMWKLFSDIKKVLDEETNYLELCIYDYGDIEVTQERYYGDHAQRIDFDCWKVDEYR